MNKSEITFENLKYLLGNLGTDILIAIGKGALDFETIELFSGVPVACIKGRIPVLLDLELVEKTSKGYVLSVDGMKFLVQFEKKS